MAKTSRSADPAELMAAGKFVQAGRIHESRHRIPEAIEAYAQGAAWSEAARLLAFQGKFAEAGRMLLRVLPPRPTPVVRLNASQKREALNAALLFARGGGRREAVGLLMNLGQHQRAAGLLQMAGLRQDAVRAMRGEPIEGSPWPPGVLHSMEAESAPADDGPSWGRAPAASSPGTGDSAPWESSRKGASPRREPPVPPWKRAQRRRGGASSPGSPTEPSRSLGDFQVSTEASPPPPPRPPSRGAPGAPPGLGEPLGGEYIGSLPAVGTSQPLRSGGSLPGAGTPQPLRSGGSLPAVGTSQPLRSGGSPLAVGTSQPLRSGGSLPAVATSQSLSAGRGDPQPPAVFSPGFGASASSAAGPPRAPASPPPDSRGTGRMLRAQPGSLVQQEIASCVATLPSDRSYPLAVRKAIELVWEVELLPPQVSRFLDDYLGAEGVSAPPASEWPTLYALARLYEFHDRLDGAQAAYRILLSGNPAFGDAAARLDQLEDGRAEAADGSWQPVHTLIDGLHRFADLPPLENVPGFSVDGSLPVEAPAASTRRRLRQDPPPGLDPTTGSAAMPQVRSTSPGGRSSGDETMDFDDYLSQQGTVGPSITASRRFGAGSRSTGAPAGSDTSGWAGDGGSDGFLESGEGGLITGSVIANRYRIEGEIGKGGMATVYRATDQELEEAVAIKVFQQAVQNRAGLDRFRREMKLSRKLVHPNIVRIYEFGTWRRARFITMELLQGVDLEGWMERFPGPCPIEASLRLLIQACDGLAAAHAAQVVHRDVKPQNLFVVEDGQKLKVMDFGIAQVNDSTANVSVTGVRVGTPRYMSPEQIQGDGTVGPAADLYALGGVAYELFTGTPAFQEEELVPLLLCHMTEEPEAPRSRHTGVPEDIEVIIVRLLKKKPEDRFADCGELKRALLQAYIHSQRV